MELYTLLILFLKIWSIVFTCIVIFNFVLNLIGKNKIAITLNTQTCFILVFYSISIYSWFI